MARVVVFFTGGTISMAADPVAGGNVPALSGSEILARTPDLERIAQVVPIDLLRVPASHFTFPQIVAIAATLREALANPAVDGAVVVQGTDTIEETAFAWDLVLESPKPVVVTGAMRASSEPGFDGPANLRDAITCAASPLVRGAGVVVTLGGSIHVADDVTKTHAASLTTSQSPNFGPIGSVDATGVAIGRRRLGRRRVPTERAAERVHLITAGVAMDGTLIDAAVTAGADGFVVEATGAGNTSGGLLDAATRAMAAGVPVVLATRCGSGRAGAAYAFPGGGATWVRAGAVLAGLLSGSKARVALALGIGAGFDRAGLESLFADPQG